MNEGRLCVKGWTAAAALTHPERLREPRVRNARGVLQPASWDEAYRRIAAGIASIRRRLGNDGIGVFGSGALTNEKAYLLGKFARVALRTRHIDYNGRYCMASGAAASIRAFGLDRGLPFPVEDIAGADVVLIAGSNPAETMPPLLRTFERQRARGGSCIVIDPRRTPTLGPDDLHLRLRPGSDAAVANGILHILVREGWVDAAYVRARTEGFDAVRSVVASYWPERCERLTGVPEAQLFDAARRLGTAGAAMVLTGRGPEQQSRGVDNVLAYINLALALGLPGKPCSGFGSITGQGNGQGGREHGQKADQLPGYRKIDDPVARRHVAAVWGVDPAELPGAGRSARELLGSIGEPDGIAGLLVFGSNVVVSSPDCTDVERRLRDIELLVVVDPFLSETAAMADVVLPSAQWAEEDGTMTNLEGRVLRRRRIVPPPGDVKTDLEILCDLARWLGRGAWFPSASAPVVFDELRRASAGGPADYSGITYEAIDATQGVFWPCATNGNESPQLGTPRLFEEQFATADGRARFHPVHATPAAEEPDESYPLYLTTGRVLAQYQSGTQTRRIPQLVRLAPEPTVQVHPETARRQGLNAGDAVMLRTRRGRARFAVQPSAAIREDTLFVPFHWGGEQAVNRLTNRALDPVSRMPEFKVCAVRIEPVDRKGGDR